ncbi:MAG: hypothetical protein WAK03_14755 [Methylocystis sp.]
MAASAGKAFQFGCASWRGVFYLDGKSMKFNNCRHKSEAEPFAGYVTAV